MKEGAFKNGDGIDFYIDGARFLPENVTYSRVILRALTIDQVKVINPVKGNCELDVSSGRSPFYGFRFEVRAPMLDPSIVVQITIEAIDRSDGLSKIAGYAYFPLFLKSATKKQVIDKNELAFMLQNGCY